MKKYIALTTGPILETLLSARYTRELWASSYVFSYLMRKIIDVLRKKENLTFIVPYVKNDIYFKTSAELSKEETQKWTTGAGLFHDRFIVKSNDDTAFETVRATIQAEIEAFGKQMAKVIGKNEQKVIDYCFDYFQFYLLEKELLDTDNPILVLSPYLNSMELQRNFVSKDKGFLATFFDRVPKSDMAKEAFIETKSFPTLTEIAAKDFEIEFKVFALNRALKPYFIENDDNDYAQIVQDVDEQIKDIEQKHKSFIPAHKYVALVHIDGDNIGKIIESLKTEAEYEDFAQKIQHYALHAAEKVQQYGGQPIYAGGDDLLCFAPVIRGKQTIFDLLKDLNTLFLEVFGEHSAKPSLSYGMSISYYKHPLYEALATSRKLLFEVAKNTEGKNTIAFQITKHSGAHFETTIRLNDPIYPVFEDILRKTKEKQAKLFSSVVYQIRKNEKMYALIGKNATAISEFIDNSFNEKTHRTDEAIAYLTAVKNLIHTIFIAEKDESTALKRIYTLLRTIAFITNSELITNPKTT